MRLRGDLPGDSLLLVLDAAPPHRTPVLFTSVTEAHVLTARRQAGARPPGSVRQLRARGGKPGSSPYSRHSLGRPFLRARALPGTQLTHLVVWENRVFDGALTGPLAARSSG